MLKKLGPNFDATKGSPEMKGLLSSFAYKKYTTTGIWIFILTYMYDHPFYDLNIEWK